MKWEHYTASALFEHRFWLQVLGDHSRFIRDALSPVEKEEVARAESFIGIFDTLLAHAREELPEARLMELNRQANEQARQIRLFKLHLLKRHLTGKIRLMLSPSFLNHMVNEVEEYIKLLAELLAGRPAPRFHPLHHHLLWLQDAYGHAASIAADLDMAEKGLMRKSETFEQHFIDFYLKAVELVGYLRTNVTEFPALSRFNKEVELEMKLFKHFLHELEEFRLDNEVLGVLSPLMADHMAREECYYLMKLAQSSAVEQPDCDPTKPRTE